MKRVIILFFTILFGLTCKADDFIYTTSGATAKITKYKGSDKAVFFPINISDSNGSYDVKSIEGIISVIDNTNVEEIFIPSGITKIKNITRESKSLKAVIIEDGIKLTDVENAFYVGPDTYSTFKLDNITVLTSCNATSQQLISSNVPNCLFKAGTIEVFYQGNMDVTTIQMYLFEIGDYKNRPFGKSRFNYLLSALQKSGKDICSITKIDLSNLLSNNTSKHAVKITFDEEGYNPSSELSSDAKIIISDTECYANGEKNTIIPDKVNFTTPETNITLNISYSREKTKEWNSVCLPFDIKETDFGANCKIYTVTAATNDQISLTRVGTSETVVEAGTPCFIYSTSDEWNLNLSNVTISNNVAPRPLEVGGNWQVIGSFTNETIGAGKYKLNSSGTEFGITNSENATVTAFRCYIAPTNPRTNAPAQLSVTIDEEASITLVPNDAEPQKVKLYDLMGRPRKEGTQGIFIKSTR